MKKLKDFEKELKKKFGGTGDESEGLLERDWCPHNFRVTFAYEKGGFTPKSGVGYTYKTANYGSEHHFINFNGCTIKVRKKTIEITNKTFGRKPITLRGTIGQRKEVMERTFQELQDYSIITLKEFIKTFGGKSDGQILNVHCENDYLNDPVVDSFPSQLHYDDHPNSKKVYAKKTEIYGVKNPVTFMSNRMVEEIAPNIASELQAVREMVKGVIEMNVVTSQTINQMSPVLADFSENIKSHTAVVKGMSKGFNKFNKLLSHSPIIKPKVSLLETLKKKVKSVDDIFKHKKLVNSLDATESKLFTDWIFMKFGCGEGNDSF